MKKLFGLFRLHILLSALILGKTVRANDLQITSISRDNGCTTLTWTSHLREYYTVYWTDDATAPIFWRIAEVNVPSGGSTTTWTESGCSSNQSMMPGNSFASVEVPQMSMTPEESAAYLYQMLLDATPGQSVAGQPRSQLPSSPDPGGGGTNTNSTSSFTAAAKFYRIARTGMAGFIDGWGHGLGTVPDGAPDVFTVSASPRDNGEHTLAVSTNGTVLVWGSNTFGQCDVPTNLTDVVAVAAGGRHSVALKRDGTVALWGTILGYATNTPGDLTNVVDVKAGLWHTMALRRDGTVSVWGDLFNRSNAVPAEATNIVAIAAGPRHCLALRWDGRVVAWGFDYPFLGNVPPTNVPPSFTNVISISAGMEHNAAGFRSGIVSLWGNTNSAAFADVSLPTNVLAVSAGWHFTSALKEDTTLISWGNLVEDTGADSIVALSAGGDYVVTIRTNSDSPVIRRQPRNLAAVAGSFTNINVVAISSLVLSYQWQKDGTNIPGATSAMLTFTNLQDSDDGLYRVLVSTTRRSFYSSGATVVTIQPPVITNQVPELELRHPQWTPTNLLVQVSSKGWPNVGYQWEKEGLPMAMEMGSSIVLSFSSAAVEGSYRVIVSNPAGSATSAVWNAKVTLRGESTVWGDNSFGQRSSLPAHSETNFVAIGAGGYFTLGLRENGTVLAWGDNSSGQTNVPAGLSNAVAIAAGGAHSLALRDNRTVIAWGNNNNGQADVPMGLSNVTSIAAGGPHSLALRGDGTLVPWGAALVPSGVSNVMAISTGGQNAAALFSNGTVQAWGSTPPAGLSNVVAISSGAFHTLALKNDGTVIGWGADGYGETTPPTGLSNVLKIAAGYQFSMALQNDGTVVSWGRNDSGQTTVLNGLGDTYAISAGHHHSVALAYDPTLNYPVTVSRDLMLIYNTTSSNSIAVKEYYRTNRPFVSEAMQLPISGYAGESYTNVNDFTNGVLSQTLNWYTNNPTRRPAYIVCFLDVPTRIDEPMIGNHGLGSVGVELRNAIGHRSPFVNYITMGAPPASFETNRLPDCFAYIDKLARFGSNYSPGKLTIRASAGGYHNDTFVLDDETRYYGIGNTNNLPNSGGLVVLTYQGLLASGISSNLLDFVPSTSDFTRYGTNLAGYESWGAYGWGFDYPISPARRVRFEGSAEWYILLTHESYNGILDTRINNGQGNYAEWFWHDAFNRTNYEGTPVGAVCHANEPGGGNVNDGTLYFGRWSQGKFFSICAWLSKRTPELLVVGDPFVRK